ASPCCAPSARNCPAASTGTSRCERQRPDGGHGGGDGRHRGRPGGALAPARGPGARTGPPPVGVAVQRPLVVAPGPGPPGSALVLSRRPVLASLECRKPRLVSSEPEEVGGTLLRAADHDPVALDEEGALQQAGVLEEEVDDRAGLGVVGGVEAELL